MTSRERILASFYGKQRDRVPWIPLCSVSFFEGLKEDHGLPDFEDSENQLDWRIRFFNDHGMDFMGWCDGPDVRTECCDITSETSKIGEDEWLAEVSTPVGKLTSTSVYHPESYSLFTKKHEIENIDDLNVAIFIAQNTKAFTSFDEGRLYLEILGDRGVAFNCVNPPGVQGALLGRFAPEAVLLWAYEENERLLAYETALHAFNLEVCKLKAAGPFQLFLNCAVLGLALVSPRIVRKHYLPFMKECNEILKAARKVMICHTSGEPFGEILDDIADAGLGGLCGLSYPAPRNTPEIWEVAERLPPETVVCGGLTPDFLYRAEPNKVREMVRELLEHTAGNSRFLLGTADDVVPHTPIQNLEAVSEVVAEFS